MIAVLAWFVGCGGDAEVADSMVEAQEGDLCDSGVRQTWETFGQGFVTSQCQGCHASTAIDRFGAPVGVVFDTEKDVIEWADRILVRATGPNADMPPAGGPSPDDRLRLERWLTCDLP